MCVDFKLHPNCFLLTLLTQRDENENHNEAFSISFILLFNEGIINWAPLRNSIILFYTLLSFYINFAVRTSDEMHPIKWSMRHESKKK